MHKMVRVKWTKKVFGKVIEIGDFDKKEELKK